MGAVALQIAAVTLATPWQLTIGLVAAILLIWKRPNTVWLMAAGAAAGWLLPGRLQ